MKKYTVSEGNTGVLELADDSGNTETFHPDYDLDKARELLFEFYELETTSGQKVKDAFQRDGTDWFPTAVSLVYWQFYFQHIKYKPLIDQYINGNIIFSKVGKGRFQKLLGSVCNQNKTELKSKGLHAFKSLYNTAIYWRNRIIAKKKGDILFFRYGVNDFRTEELYNELKRKFHTTQVTHVPVRILPHYFFRSDVIILTTAEARCYFDVELSKGAPLIHKFAFSYVKNIISKHIRTFSTYSLVAKKLDYRLFFGIDDANHIYPFLYAVQDAGIPTLGFQHGTHVKRHEPYYMHGIDRYRWYDNVLVWGEYWRRIILKHSKLFDESFHLLSSNKNNYDYTRLEKTVSEKTVLVPYEFLTDTIKVGEYIKKLIKKGFVVYFKPRADEMIQDQIKAYYLGEHECQLKILPQITAEAMAQIDVIAGTATALLFDLLPYNKPIWIFETPFRLMYDMVEDGYARLIREEDMEDIESIYQEEIARKRSIDIEYIFGSRPVPEVIEEYMTAGGAPA